MLCTTCYSPIRLSNGSLPAGGARVFLSALIRPWVYISARYQPFRWRRNHFRSDHPGVTSIYRPCSETEQCTTNISAQLRFPQSCLVTDVQGASLPKAEICHAALDENLANEHSSWIPYVDAVAAATVNVAAGVAFDAIRTARLYKCKKTSIHKKWS